MSEKKVGKRLLTWVLVLVMTLSLLPLNVLADEFDDSEKLEQVAENEDFRMEKAARPNPDGTYDITLQVTPLKADAVKPLELVILLDLSGSMAWCTDNYTYGRHTHEGGSYPYCSEVYYGRRTARITYATNAINKMVSDLQKNGVIFHLSVVKFAEDSTKEWHDGYNGAYPVIDKKLIEDTADVADVASTLANLKPKGGTYMTKGLEVAEEQFTDATDTEKVFIMLADGKYDDSNSKTITNAADSIKNIATAYTIGFTTSVAILKDIATSPNHYSQANSGAALSGIMAQITEEIKPAFVTDNMGSYVSLVKNSAEVAAGSGSFKVTNNAIEWSLGKTEKDKTQTLTYTVAPILQPGTHKYYLNGDVTLWLHCHLQGRR